MLEIKVPAKEFFNEKTNEFEWTKECTLRLEHSLISISKWETLWKKPFLKEDPKTYEESLSYIKCMTVSQSIDDKVYESLTPENYQQINDYIDTSQSATWFSETSGSVSREIITSELIYYWMVAYQIPWEAQKWPLSRLLTLIRICNIKNSPDKKMSKREILSRNAAINKARRMKSKSKG